MTDTRFVRTKGGSVVHRNDCRYAASKSAVPWKWAEGRSLESVFYTVYAVVEGITDCGHCKPFQDVREGGAE